MNDVDALIERITELYKQERTTEAARLLPALQGALTGLLTPEELATWPVCAACLGTGELPDATFEGRRLSCITNSQLCRGNQMGRMSPVQFAAFMREKLPAVDADGQPVMAPPHATVNADDPKPTVPPGFVAGWLYTPKV